MSLLDHAQESRHAHPENAEPVAGKQTVEHHLHMLALATPDDRDDLLTELLCVTHRTLRAQTN